MNSKRLKIYLDDHLALMVAEVELIGRCWWNNRGTPLGDFLQRLENEVKAQQSIVADVMHRLGGKHSIEGRLKRSAAWFAEKLGRFKLNDSLLSYSELSRVVELETLSAAAQGRISMWDNFENVLSKDARVKDITFSFFREQAQQHLDELNTRRRFAAAEAFADLSLPQLKD